MRFKNVIQNFIFYFFFKLPKSESAYSGIVYAFSVLVPRMLKQKIYMIVIFSV